MSIYIAPKLEVVWIPELNQYNVKNTVTHELYVILPDEISYKIRHDDKEVHYAFTLEDCLQYIAQISEPLKMYDVFTKSDLEDAFNAGTNWQREYHKYIPNEPPFDLSCGRADFRPDKIQVPDFDKYFDILQNNK